MGIEVTENKGVRIVREKFRGVDARPSIRLSVLIRGENAL